MDVPDQDITWNTRIQQKKDTDVNWTSNNPVLLENELIIVEMESGECRFKIGDGVHAYKDLPFLDQSLRDDIAAAQEAAERAEALVYSGAGAHNSVYRGKNLGSSVTAEQYAAIAAGTFNDLYIGDYWTIGGVTYRIAAFDYYLQTGDTPCTDHHAVIVPDSGMYDASMNDTNTTAGGYGGSKLRTSGLDTAKATILGAFGADHILTHRQLFSNVVNDGASSAWAWYDSQIDLMNEHMVYGAYAWGGGSQNGYDTGIDKIQLPLFRARPDLISGRGNWWLRDVRSAALFCNASEYGYASGWDPSGSIGVRPAFCIHG